MMSPPQIRYLYIVRHSLRSPNLGILPHSPVVPDNRKPYPEAACSVGAGVRGRVRAEEAGVGSLPRRGREDVDKHLLQAVSCGSSVNFCTAR